MLALARIGVGRIRRHARLAVDHCRSLSKNDRPRALGVYAIGTYAGTFTTVGALLFIWAARSIRADIQRAS